MHVHLPKPLHGWREFLGEVGIIVIGVLIALSAEQFIERLHWEHQVEAGRDVLHDDLVTIVSNADERRFESACLGQRFGQIAAILDAASQAGQLPPVGPIGNPPMRPWSVGSWSSLVASQTSLHMPRAEMMSFAAVANYAELIGRFNQQEQDDWSTLHTIVGPGRRFGDSEQASVRKSLAHAIYLAKLMKLASEQITREIGSSGVITPAEMRSLHEESKASWQRAESARRRMCGPIGPAPAQYDSSPLSVPL